MFSPDTTFEAENGLRFRPMPEWDKCIVYSRRSRKLVMLNHTARLILQACAKPCTSSDVYLAVSAAAGGEAYAPEAHAVHAGVLKLVQLGLLRSLGQTTNTEQIA